MTSPQHATHLTDKYFHLLKKPLWWRVEEATQIRKDDRGKLKLQPLRRVLDGDRVDLVLGEVAGAHLGNYVADDVRVAVTAELNLQ